ncbi:MAG TPA: hypothetical protein VGJ69_05840 [Pyrinomonadaceae bacterium]|jgi:hypothetical protein
MFWCAGKFQKGANEALVNTHAVYTAGSLTRSTSAFLGNATATSRIRAQDIMDSYQVSQARLKEHPRWSKINSDRSDDEPDARVANLLRTLVAEGEFSGILDD